MRNNELSFHERHRRRNRLIGAITLLALAALFGLSLFFKNRQQIDEAVMLERADREMAAGAAGFCGAYSRASEGYAQAMRLHFQHKELTAKTAVARDLSQRCLIDQAENIALRRQVVDGGRFSATDVKELALAYLAAGDKHAALTVLATQPDDEFCRWLGDWLHSLPLVDPDDPVWE